MTAREPALDEVFRELEARVARAVQEIRKLKHEKADLERRIADLERTRVQAVERLNIILDRIETLG
jgi:cell division protein FtsB